jgi:hypothetical protein
MIGQASTMQTIEIYDNLERPVGYTGKCLKYDRGMIIGFAMSKLYSEEVSKPIRKPRTLLFTEYYKEGVLHREDGPARCRQSTVADYAATTEYFQEGKLHREDGPAYDTNIVSRWFYNGLLHRENGPAVEWNHGGCEWWDHGIRHNDSGPALITADSYQLYYIHGDEVDFPAFELFYMIKYRKAYERYGTL